MQQEDKLKSKGTKKKKKKKSTALGIFKIIFLIFISIIVLAGVAAGGVALAMIKTAPPLDVNAILTLNEPSTLYDDHDQYMDDVITDEKRTVISAKDMPANLKNAVVAIEDERFYKHHGIDPRRIIGSLYIDIMNKLKHTRGLHGASTITQQLLKNTVLNSDVTFKRKIQEMYLAIQLEKKITKEQILEAYMNTIFLGGRAHGVEAAANQYFNTDAKNLNLIQSAFIAGLTQSPSVYYPFSEASTKNPNIYLNRTKNVLDKMYENGYITKQQFDQAINDLNNKKLVFQKPSKASNRLNNEWFSLPAIEQVKKDLKDQYHYNDSEINNLLMYGGLKIYTTMDKTLQNSAQKVFNEDSSLAAVTSNDAKGIPQPQGSAVVVDYHTGEVKAIIGGRGNQPPRSYNRAAYNGSKAFLRPTGSSIKPLTVYSAAIDSGQATAATMIEDSPLPPEIGKLYGPPGQPYNPKNYDTEGFSGDVTVRQAIQRSINLVAIKLEHQIGLNTGVSYGSKFGLTFDNDDKSSIAALSLGELHHGANTLTMAAAYGTFGNNGLYTAPRLYRKVVDKRGLTILETKPANTKVLSPQAAFVMYDLLKGPTSPGGTAPNARFGDMPVAGKTGTSGDKKDFWFCGLTPYYSAAVWIGNDNPKTYSRGIYSSTAAGIWAKIMQAANKDKAVKDITKPDGIVSASICMDSGKIPTDLCSRDPRGNRVVTDIFVSGTVPTTLCDAHIEASVNKINGKLANANTPKDLIETRVFIKRQYASSDDQQYVLPTESDDMKPEQNTSGNKENTGDKNTGTNQGTEQGDDEDTNTNKGNNTGGNNTGGNNSGNTGGNANNGTTDNPPKDSNGTVSH